MQFFQILSNMGTTNIFCEMTPLNIHLVFYGLDYTYMGQRKNWVYIRFISMDGTGLFPGFADSVPPCRCMVKLLIDLWWTDGGDTE